MKWFNDLRLSGKLLLAFTAVLTVTLAVGALSIVRLGDVSARQCRKESVVGRQRLAGILEARVEA